MGSCCSSTGGDKVGPEVSTTQLHEISKTESEVEVYKRKDRSCTDVFFFLLLLAFSISLIGLVIYCAIRGDIFRIINGYDKCGNVCGKKNVNLNNKDFPCFGEDMTSKKLLKITELGAPQFDYNNLNRECVSECPPDYQKFINRCLPKVSEKTEVRDVSKTGLPDFFQEVSEDLELCWREVLYLCLIALGFCIVILLLFRFLVGVLVWVVLIGVSLASIAGTIFLWILWKQKKDSPDQNDKFGRTVTAYLAYAIVATIVTVIILLIILVMRKRIQLVIQLFKEAGKAIHSMPLLLFEPFLTFLSLACVVASWFFFCIFIESSGYLTVIADNEKYYYKKDVIMKVTRWYNLFGLFWLTQFVIGCQHMVIAGAVSKWFFTRNKNELGYPITKSFNNLVCYHLGTVATGSLLIAIVKFLRAMLTFLQNRMKGYDNSFTKFLVKCCHCCLWCLEKFLQFLSRNAYIQTAIHGTNFCTSGKRAFELLASNALRVAVINSVGDFVLFLGKVMVVVATVLIGVRMLDNIGGLHHIWVPIVLVGIFAYIVSDCFITVFEMAIDTIFLCFCEDCEKNDGISRPYFMSRGLMEFVQNSKKAMGILDSSRNTPNRAWSPDSGRTNH